MKSCQNLGVLVRAKPVMSGLWWWEWWCLRSAMSPGKEVVGEETSEDASLAFSAVVLEAYRISWTK